MIRARFIIPLLLTVVALLAGGAMVVRGELTPVQMLPLALAAASVAWVAASVPSLVSRQVDRILDYARSDRDGDDLGDLRDRPDELGSLADAVIRQVDRTHELEAANTSLADALATTITDATRRSLVLVHRLLARLDELQKGEDDPKRLSELYELDHLSVRLRRQAENMLVVADDAPLGDSDEPPMRLVDVVRMAASETEEYRRVEVRVGSLASVTGWSARPLGQLLAALLDNALRYSPPNSAVMVASVATPEATALHIRDRGLGMDDEAIQAANALLSAPPPLHQVESRQLGLYVVSVLAARLGIGVMLLTPGDPDGGVEARVVVPTGLLEHGSEHRVTRSDVAHGAVLDLMDPPVVSAADEVTPPSRSAAGQVPAFEPTPEVPIPTGLADPDAPAAPARPAAEFDPFADVITDQGMVAGVVRPSSATAPITASAAPTAAQAPNGVPATEQAAPEAHDDGAEDRKGRPRWIFGRRPTAQTWSTTLPGHDTDDDEGRDAAPQEGREVSFVAAPDEPRPTADTPGPVGPRTGFVAGPDPVAAVVAAPRTAPPKAPEPVPDDHVPSVVDNPMSELFTAELQSVQLPTAVADSIGGLSLPAVLDGIVVGGVDAPVGLPARPAAAGEEPDDEPITRLFAGRPSASDDAIQALADLVRVDGDRR